MRYMVVATLSCRSRDKKGMVNGWTYTKQVPTFFVDAFSREEAKKKAFEVINVFPGDKLTVSLENVR